VIDGWFLKKSGFVRIEYTSLKSFLLRRAQHGARGEVKMAQKVIMSHKLSLVGAK
jgi:hypothetical protein